MIDVTGNDLDGNIITKKGVNRIVKINDTALELSKRERNVKTMSRNVIEILLLIVHHHTI